MPDEAQVEQNYRWSQSLCKTKVSEEIFDGIESVADDVSRERLSALRELCAARIESVERVREVRAELKALRKQRRLTADERDVFEAAEQELREIAEDLRFASTRRGRFVLAAQDWVQMAYVDVRADPRFGGVMVGLHGDREALVAHGHVADDAALRDLRALLGRHAPPWPLDDRVRICGA